MGFSTRDVAVRVSGVMIFFGYWRGRNASMKDRRYELRDSSSGGGGRGFEMYARTASAVSSGASLTGCFSSARGDSLLLLKSAGSVVVLEGAVVSWTLMTGGGGKGRLTALILAAVGGLLEAALAAHAGTRPPRNSLALAFATTAQAASCYAIQSLNE